jgi:hypothetical protein
VQVCESVRRSLILDPAFDSDPLNAAQVVKFQIMGIPAKTVSDGLHPGARKLVTLKTELNSFL